MTLNIAIVGCGKIADSHVAEIRKLGFARLMAVCDLEPHSDLSRMPVCLQQAREEDSVRPLPYFATRLPSRALVGYHRYSKGQLPAVLTPYKVKSLWAGNRFDNSKLHSIGWQQLVPTPEALRTSFEHSERSSIRPNDGIAPTMRIIFIAQSIS